MEPRIKGQDQLPNKDTTLDLFPIKLPRRQMSWSKSVVYSDLSCFMRNTIVPPAEISMIHVQLWDWMCDFVIVLNTFSFRESRLVETGRGTVIHKE